MNIIAIIVPGLGDNKESFILKKWWAIKKGIKIMTFQTKWKTNENYQDKLNRLINLIDNESQKGVVSLIGTSAGGSLVVNAFAEKKDKIDKIITVCSRLRKGKLEGFRGFIKRTKGYSAFSESVIKSEEKQTHFSKKEKERIMTIHALFGDELVPTETTLIDQAKNIFVPMIGHSLSIVSSLTIFSKMVVQFIMEK